MENSVLQRKIKTMTLHLIKKQILWFVFFFLALEIGRIQFLIKTGILIKIMSINYEILKTYLKGLGTFSADSSTLTFR